MPTPETLLAFTLAALLMNIMPGPSNFYVLSRTLVQGRRGGIAAALGLAAGSLLHVAAAGLGLSVVFAYSPLAFTLVKLAGAAYLVYIGLKTLLARDEPAIAPDAPGLPAKALRRVFAESVVIELLNPKTALFFLAFLPQFVDPAGEPLAQILVLGFIVTLTALPCDLLVTWAGAAVARGLARRPTLQRLQRWLAGSVLTGLGVRVALDR
jgi:threonine/homoserine/homoserine lactone efflux protein